MVQFVFGLSVHRVEECRSQGNHVLCAYRLKLAVFALFCYNNVSVLRRVSCCWCHKRDLRAAKCRELRTTAPVLVCWEVFVFQPGSVLNWEMLFRRDLFPSHPPPGFEFPLVAIQVTWPKIIGAITCQLLSRSVHIWNYFYSMGLSLNPGGPDSFLTLCGRASLLNNSRTILCHLYPFTHLSCFRSNRSHHPSVSNRWPP